jgi:hypothetical protein
MCYRDDPVVLEVPLVFYEVSNLISKASARSWEV